VDFAEKKVTIDEDVRDGYNINKEKESRHWRSRHWRRYI
jgi:hypothetical protein